MNVVLPAAGVRVAWVITVPGWSLGISISHVPFGSLSHASSDSRKVDHGVFDCQEDQLVDVHCFTGSELGKEQPKKSRASG